MGCHLASCSKDVELVATGDSGVASADARTADAADDGGTDTTTEHDADAALDDRSTAEARERCPAGPEADDLRMTRGYRIVAIADNRDGIHDPSSLIFAGDAYLDRLYVANSSDGFDASIVVIDPRTGESSVFVHRTAWNPAPFALSALVWDANTELSGTLLVVDEGSNDDQDSRIYSLSPTGQVTTFFTAPGPGMDDASALAFAPAESGYPSGLYVTGDRDTTGIDWGILGARRPALAFSDVEGVQSIAFDTPGGIFGGKLYAARPSSGGFSGNDTITPIMPDGTPGTPLVVSRPGIHAITIGPGGHLGRDMYALSWETGQLLRIDPTGATRVLASGLRPNIYNGNALAFTPAGDVLFIADHDAHRILCLEHE